MNIYILTPQNLSNQAFIKELVFHFKPKGKAILLHAAFGGPQDTRFVSKRLSAFLSEELIVNNILHGDQRNFIQLSDGGVQVRRYLLDEAFAQVQLVVMNPLVAGGGELAETSAVAQALKSIYPEANITLFPGHHRSALGQHGSTLHNADEVDALMGIYDEDSTMLQWAKVLLPVRITNPDVAGGL